MHQAIKKIYTKCLVCRRLQGKPYSSVNAPPLPDFRVQRVDPFQVTSVDFTGAIQVRRVIVIKCMPHSSHVQ